ncbi:RHS repeat domain-containing protein, partial [Janthinobacterium lividum]
TNTLGAQLAHQYDAFGNLIQTRDAMQNVISVKYDIRGRKKEMVDPDTGWWQYDYNALGELVWQQSPNQRALNQATTLEYDLLGRLINRSEPEYASYWRYD